MPIGGAFRFNEREGEDADRFKKALGPVADADSPGRGVLPSRTGAMRGSSLGPGPNA